MKAHAHVSRKGIRRAWKAAATARELGKRARCADGTMDLRISLVTLEANNLARVRACPFTGSERVLRVHWS
jgi:hypothetical protein